MSGHVYGPHESLGEPFDGHALAEHADATAEMTCVVCGKSLYGQPYWYMERVDSFGHTVGDGYACDTTCLRAFPPLLQRSVAEGDRDRSDFLGVSVRIPADHETSLEAGKPVGAAVPLPTVWP